MSASHAMQGEDLYCKLFVAGAADYDALSEAVNAITGGSGASGADPAEVLVLEIYVKSQSRHLPLSDEQDDFMLWRHYIDIDAADAHTPFDAFFAEVVRLVVGLRARGLRVVAACDFEDELEAAVRGAGSA